MNKRKILIVDDEEGFSRLVQVSLEDTGKYDVRIENEATHALMTALAYRPDLILLDIIMASKEGPDVAIEIKEDPRLKEIPIVFLTATVTQAEINAEGGKIGGHPFVAKPSSLETLLESIEKNILAS